MRLTRAVPPARPSARPSRQRLLGAWLALAFPIAACIASPAHAAADCSITAVNLDFAGYDPALATADDSAGSVTVTCRHVSAGATRVNYRVTLSNGMYGTSATTRQMAAGSGRLGFNVFTDPSRSRVWGNGSNGTVIASGSMTVGPGNGNNTRTATHTVYGRIPQLQDAVPGAYRDTLVVTLIY